MDSATMMKVGLVSLCVVAANLGFLAWAYRRAALRWQATAQHWFDAYRLAETIPEPKRVLRDIFAPVVPSQIGISLPDATNDSEAAREVLALTIGETEIEQ